MFTLSIVFGVLLTLGWTIYLRKTQQVGLAQLKRFTINSETYDDITVHYTDSAPISAFGGGCVFRNNVFVDKYHPAKEAILLHELRHRKSNTDIVPMLVSVLGILPTAFLPALIVALGWYAVPAVVITSVAIIAATILANILIELDADKGCITRADRDNMKSLLTDVYDSIKDETSFDKRMLSTSISLRIAALHH